MVLVGTEVAGAPDRREDALAVGPSGEFAQDRGGAVGTVGLRVPPALLHDDRHRRLGRAAGALVLEFLGGEPALDLGVIRKKRLMTALDDLPFGHRRDLAVARPLQRLAVKREALP
jgi:hypothetical protein